jgi:hypothetical protein
VVGREAVIAVRDVVHTVCHAVALFPGLAVLP